MMLIKGLAQYLACVLRKWELEFPGGSVGYGPGVVTVVAWVTTLEWVQSLCWKLLYAGGMVKKEKLLRILQVLCLSM